MRKVFNIILIVVFCLNNMFGQKMLLTLDSDTSFWYNIKLGYEKRYELFPMLEMESNRHFRFWGIGNMLEIYELDTILIGNFYLLAGGVRDLSTKGEYYKKCYKLEKSSMLNILKLLDSLKINEIPSGRKVKNWSRGLDGVQYILEYKEDSLYSFKSYWTPEVQKNIVEADILLNFIGGIIKNVNYDVLKNDFEKDLPFRSWSYNGSMISRTRGYTKQEYRKQKRFEKKKRNEK